MLETLSTVVLDGSTEVDAMVGVIVVALGSLLVAFVDAGVFVEVIVEASSNVVRSC